MIDLAKTNPKWLGFATEGYVFAALVYFIFCYSMSSSSHVYDFQVKPLLPKLFQKGVVTLFAYG
jgi:general L-amino acid transport system permease protein